MMGKSKRKDSYGTMDMLASIFQSTFKAEVQEHWRPGIAAAFRNVGDALRAGASSEEVAVICLFAADAVEDPSTHEKTLRAATEALETL